MRNFLICLFILGLDVAFALASARIYVIEGAGGQWMGVPVSMMIGVTGVVALVVITLLVALLAFPSREASR